MTHYFKSMTENNGDYTTGTFNPSSSRTELCQTLKQILSSRVIAPNTVHCQIPKRLSASAFSINYNSTYRPEGLLFKTDENPDWVFPFDLMYLSEGESFTSADYHARMLEGYESFCFPTLDEMAARFPVPGMAWEEMNKFRQERGLPAIAFNERKAYNECIFFRELAIEPAAVIGSSKRLGNISGDFAIPIHPGIDDFMYGKHQR